MKKTFATNKKVRKGILLSDCFEISHCFMNHSQISEYMKTQTLFSDSCIINESFINYRIFNLYCKYLLLISINNFASLEFECNRFS